MTSFLISPGGFRCCKTDKLCLNGSPVCCDKASTTVHLYDLGHPCFCGFTGSFCGDHGVGMILHVTVDWLPCRPYQVALRRSTGKWSRSPFRLDRGINKLRTQATARRTSACLAQVDSDSLELRAYPAVTHHSTLESGRQLL